MTKIFVTRPLPQTVMANLDTLGEVNARTQTTALSKEEMISALCDYDIILPTLGDLFSRSVFEQSSNIRCKLLANFGVGFNHIDVQAAQEHGVQVTNTPGAVTDATADIAMTLMLMTARRAGEGERLVRAQKWEGWHPVQMLGLHLTGKTVAIIGMGRIGQAIAKRCHFGFDMKIIYVSRSEKDLTFPAERYNTLDEAARKADVVVVAVPGGVETRHLINAAFFSAMPSHAIFVNIARGDVVDEAALIAALDAHSIGGAGLDVYEFEPKVPQDLLDMEQVTLLPHLGTASLEVRTQMGNMAVDNIRAFVAKKSLFNPV